MTRAAAPSRRTSYASGCEPASAASPSAAPATPPTTARSARLRARRSALPSLLRLRCPVAPWQGRQSPAPRQTNRPSLSGCASRLPVVRTEVVTLKLEGGSVRGRDKAASPALSRLFLGYRLLTASSVRDGWTSTCCTSGQDSRCRRSPARWRSAWDHRVPQRSSGRPDPPM